MKKKWIILILIGFVLLFTGCDSFSLPEEMIKRPIMDKQITEAASQIANIQNTYEIILPRNLENAAAANYADLTGDGKDEMIILYKEKDKLNEFGIRILREYINKWEYMDSINGTAVDIQDVILKDVNNDGKSDIIVIWLDENKKLKTQIYIEKNEKMIRVFEVTSDEIEVIDLDGDDIQDIVTVDSMEDKSLKATLYNIGNTEDPEINTVFINSDRRVRTVRGNAGKVTQDRNGIVLEIPFGTKQGYTEILVKEDGLLKKVFSSDDDFGITQSSSITNNEDIDNDGIIEINILYSEERFDEKYSNNQSPIINKWYNWDGKDGLILKGEIYSDSSNGFMFSIPERWVGNYAIEVNEGSKVQYLFIYDILAYPMMKNEMARIAIVEESYKEVFKKKVLDAGRRFVLIGDNGKNYYYLENSSENDNIQNVLGINDDEIMENFKIIR